MLNLNSRYLSYALGGCLLVGILALMAFDWADSRESAQPVTIASIPVDEVHPLPDGCRGYVLPLTIETERKFGYVEGMLEAAREECRAHAARMFELVDAQELNKLEHVDQGAHRAYMALLAVGAPPAGFEVLKENNSAYRAYLDATAGAQAEYEKRISDAQKWYRDMNRVAYDRYQLSQKK